MRFVTWVLLVGCASRNFDVAATDTGATDAATLPTDQPGLISALFADGSFCDAWAACGRSCGGLLPAVNAKPVNCEPFGVRACLNDARKLSCDALYDPIAVFQSFPASCLDCFDKPAKSAFANEWLGPDFCARLKVCKGYNCDGIVPSSAFSSESVTCSGVAMKYCQEAVRGLECSAFKSPLSDVRLNLPVVCQTCVD